MNSPDNSKDGARAGERIAKLLARAGIASRREVERMIAEGRVKLNGEVLDTPNTVLPGLKGMTVDDKPVKAAEAARLFVFHKPGGLITTERDPAGRPTIYTALRNALPENAGRVMPIGRLDFNTEGLLLLTNDGELKRAMELPKTGLPRTYRARTFGDITQEQLEELIEGIEIDGVRYGKIDANMERRTGRNQWIEVTITEGKNREVRRVLEYLGLEVSRLIRTAYGPFELLDLPRGQAVEIRQVEVERLRKSLLGGGEAYVPLSAPQQARARISRTRSPGARPTARRAEDRRSEDRRPGGERPKAAPRRDERSAERKPIEGKLSPRKPAGGRPEGGRTEGGRYNSERPSGGRSGARSGGPRSEGPRSGPSNSRGPRNPDPNKGGPRR